MAKNFKDMFEDTSDEDWGKWRKEKQKGGGKRIAETSVEGFAERIKGLECIQDIWNVRCLIYRIVMKRDREFAELEAQLDYHSGYNYPESLGSDAIGVVEEQSFLSQFEVEYRSLDQTSNKIPLLTDKKRKELSVIFGRDSILFRQKMGIRVEQEPPEYRQARKKLQAFLKAMNTYENEIIRVRNMVKLGPPKGLIVINKSEFFIGEIEEAMAEVENIGIGMGNLYGKSISHEIVGTLHIQGHDSVVKKAKTKYIVHETATQVPIHVIVGNTYNAAMECLAMLEERYSQCTSEDYLIVKKYLENIRFLGEASYPH